MIIVNYFLPEDYDPRTDTPIIEVAGIANDVMDLQHDPQLILDALSNDPDFEPQAGEFYEVVLDRAVISADPVPEAAFLITKFVQLRYLDGWQKPMEIL